MVVLPDESVRLEPACERSLGSLEDLVAGCLRQLVEGSAPDGDECALLDFRPVRVQVHPHTRLKLIDTQPRRSRAPLLDRLDEVIGRALDPLTVAKRDAIDRLPPVV